MGFPLRSETELLRIVTMQVAPAGIKENGENKGAVYEISNEIARRANLNYVNSIKPYRRMIHDLTSGKSDMSIFTHNTNLGNKVIEVIPVYHLKTLVVGRKVHDIQSLEELKGKKVGIVRGTSLSDEPEISQMKLVQFKDFKQGLKMLLAGRIKALVGVDLALYYWINKMDISRKDLGQPYIFKTQGSILHVSHHFDDKAAITRLKAAVISMQQDGTVTKIWSKYLAE
ncbi:substrate-binding periplasmic protein [Vibrio profundum]|uniref:substrate-binding periplasmic protein n=1 Tax=Vibrio profundum TaxID=2910247 RepID=UPI003D11F176